MVEVLLVVVVPSFGRVLVTGAVFTVGDGGATAV